MKKYISSASKRVSSGPRRGSFVYYDSADEILTKVADATGWRIGSYVRGSDPVSLDIPVTLFSGPAEVHVEYPGDSHVGDFVLSKDGQVLLSTNWYAVGRKGGASTYYRYNALKSLAAGAEKSLSRLSDPSYQREKQRKALIAEHRSLSTAEIADCVSSNMPETRLKQAIDNLRYQLTDDDWANLSSWRFTESDPEVESWASIYVQGYGYSYTWPVTLDTGVNTYETTLHKTEGWHTE